MNLSEFLPERASFYYQQTGRMMIALLISIYTIGFLCFGSLVVLIAMICTFFGEIPGITFIKLFIVSLLWPIMLLWGAGNVFYKRVTKGEKPSYSRN